MSYIRNRDLRGLRVRILVEIKTADRGVFSAGTLATVRRVERMAGRTIIHMETDDGREVRLRRKRIRVIRPQQPMAEMEHRDE